MAKIVVTEEASAPASPAANNLTMYCLDGDADANKVFYSKNPSGNIRVMANIPPATQTHDLGSSSLAWRNLFLGGTSNVAKIVPGSTSISLRNNADNADNLIVTDAGVVTIRAGLTITAGSLTMGTASSKIVPGATALLLRNNADSANNISITDAGDVTVRATITASTGLTVTSGSVSLPAASVDPSNINHTRVCWDSGTATVTASYANVTNGTERVDTAAINASGLTTFTAGTAGTYLVFASASFVLGSNYSAYLRIAKNGADAAGTEVQIGAIIPQAGTPIIMGSTQCIVTVANTDTISLQIKGDAGSSVIGATLLLIRVA